VPGSSASVLVRGSGAASRRLQGRPFGRGRIRPAWRALGIFLLVLSLGTVLLTLPWASASGAWTAPLDAFFTAASAFTGTGLVVVDTGTYWSGLGQTVILVLIVLGGIGVMASTAVVLVVIGRRADLRSRLMIRDGSGGQVGDTRSIVMRTIRFTVSLTAAGAVVLTALAWLRAPDDPASAAWWGLFHAASSFNNAGFDLTAGSRGMAPYASDPAMLAALMGLMLVGSLGLVVCADLWQWRQTRHLSLGTRIVIATTSVLIVLGMIGLLLVEWDNPQTLGTLDPVDRPVNALFTSISARSTGMSTLDIGGLRPESLTLVTFLMFIGGAVGSTAGGIRVSTLAVLAIVTFSTLRRRSEPAAFGARLGSHTIHAAITVTLISVTVVVLGVLLLQSATRAPAAARGAIAFDTVSAFSTTGLSVGDIGALDEPARIVLTGCMLLGRLSILWLAIVFSRGPAHSDVRKPRGSIDVA
jgi:trk system potassium uptake protein TrkH